MMLKSSWMLIFLLNNFLVSGQDQQQQVQTNDLPPRSENDRNTFRTLGSLKFITHVYLEKLRIIAFDQVKVYENFRERQIAAVKPSTKILYGQELEILETTSSLSYGRLIGPQIYEQQGAKDDDKLVAKLTNIKSNLKQIKEKANQTVLKDGSANIMGHVAFILHKKSNEIKLISQSIDVLEPVLSEPLDDFVDRKSASAHQVFGTVSLARKSTVNRIIAPSINHLNFKSDVVFKGRKQQNILGPLRVASLVTDTATIEPSDSQTGDQIDDLVFISSKMPLSISTPLYFNYVFVDSDLNVPIISNTHLPTFRSLALTYNTKQTVNNEIKIRSAKVPSVNLEHQLNGLDYNQRIGRLLRTDIPIKVPKLIISSRSLKAEKFTVRSSINKQRFPNDFLLINQDQVISSSINFANLTVSRSAKINGLINGYRFPNDFVTLDGNDTFRSDLIFTNSVIFKRDVNLQDFIGRHKIRSLVDWINAGQHAARQIGDNPSGNLIVHGDLRVNTINGFLFDGFLNDLVHLSDPKTVEITGTKTFINPLHLSSITVRDINGLSVNNFATTSKPIDSLVRFDCLLQINDLIAESTRKNNQVLDLVNRRISLIHNGTIAGDIFIENMNINSLEINKKYSINRLSPQSLVFKSQKQQIRGPLTFLDVSFQGPISATKVDIGRTFNNRDVYRVFKTSLNRRSLQNISLQSLTLRNCIVNNLSPNRGDWQVQDKFLVNSLKNLLLKNDNQNISGRKRFIFPIIFASNILSSSSHGILEGIQDISHRSMMFRRSNFTIKESRHLFDLTIYGNLIINGKLNGIDFSTPLIDLQNDKNNRPAYSMVNHQSFYSGLEATSVKVNFINGQPFQKFWSQSKSLQFMVPITIRHLTVDGHVTTTSLVNQLPIQNIVKQIQSQQINRSITIKGNVIFKSSIKLQNNLRVSGTINNVSFDWLLRSLAKLWKTEQLIGYKSVQSINILGNLFVDRFNHQQLSPQLHNIVLIHPGSLAIASPVEFKSIATIKGNIDCDYSRINFNSNLNGISLRNLVNYQKKQSNQWDQVYSRINSLEKSISSYNPIYTRLINHIELMSIKGFQVVAKIPTIGSAIDCHPIDGSYSIKIGSTVDEKVTFSEIIFNGSMVTELRPQQLVTPYIAAHSLRLDQFYFYLYQASPNSTTPSILVDQNQKTVGQLTGRAYDDLQILSIGHKDAFISALSSVRGVVETFTLILNKNRPTIRLISTINVTPSARKISIFTMMNQIYLAVARSPDYECESDHSSSLLFQWIETKFKLIQKFGHFEASNVIHYNFNGHYYLVFSESKNKVNRLTDKTIHVYQSIFKKWPSCQFNHFHSINVEQTIDLQAITIKKQPPSRPIQLLAALNPSTLTIWQQKGNAGFSRIWSQALHEGQSFKFFIMNSNIYLIVAQSSRNFGSFIMQAII